MKVGPIRVFISYALADEPLVQQLCERLKQLGLVTLMSQEIKRPEVRQLIREADIFMLCFSPNSGNRRGITHHETRLALYGHSETTHGDIYLIPILLAECKVPDKFGQYHWVKLYEEQGWENLLRALQILMIRKAVDITDLIQLDLLVSYFPQDGSGGSNEIQQLLSWISEIVQLQARLNTIHRPAFRNPTAESLCYKIENFRYRIAGLREPLSSEFRAAATKWLEIAQHQFDEVYRITSKEPAPQLFRAGDPVDREQEAFVPRYAVIGELEQQIMLSTGCPGIVLYGRRRMGKSTILRNLTDFLPTNVTPIVVSMQRPEMFASIASLTGFVSRELHAQLDGADNEEVSNLTGFFQTLKTINDHLEADDKRLLLAVDEYETIDKKIGEGVFPLELLDTIRESIQSHRRITWVFAGSHEITELQHAAWTSYLVSARTIEVPFFTLAETRLLLTDPVKHSTLWRNNPDKRPRFDAAFWGEGGIERIQAEAGGWPHLVQLIAETIVDLINEEDADGVSPELMERALNKAIVRGHNVLYQLMRGESLLPGEWDYLSAFREVEQQAPPKDAAVNKSLRRRLLIEENGGQWQLRVPLMARWLKVRGE